MRPFPDVRPIAAAVLAALLVAPAAARADEAEEVEPPPKRVKADAAVVASRLATEPEGVTVRTLTRAEIARLPVRSLPELLQTLPGVDVRRRGLDGVQADIGIRGADHNGTLILVDGESVNDPQTNHHSASLDVPLDAVERVEVLYGGASALYGSDAVGGVVNVVTRGANLGRARAQVEGRYAHGTRSLDGGSARIASRIGDYVSLAVDASRSESSGFRDDTEFAQGALRSTLRLDTGAGPLSLAVGAAERDFGAYGFYGTRYPDQKETTRTQTARLSGQLRWGSLTVEPSAAWRGGHDDFVLDRARPDFYRNVSDTGKTAFRLIARTGLLGGSAAFGAEGGRETVDSTNLGAHGRTRGAAFAEWGTTFGPPGASRGGVRAGLRLDAYEEYGSRLSPQVAAWAALGRDVKLRASLGTAFRVPTFTELYYSDPQTVSSPDLQPETATNVESGLTFTTSVLVADGAVFFRRGRNLIDYVRSSPDEPYTARNVRTADAWGVEGTLELAQARLERGLLSRAALSATYVFTDLAALSQAADGATEGRYVLDPLHVKWELLLGFRLPERITGLARLSYLSRPSFADGVLLLGARLGLSVLDGEILEIYAEAENLGDVGYEEAPGVPLPGRTGALGLRLTW